MTKTTKRKTRTEKPKTETKTGAEWEAMYKAWKAAEMLTPEVVAYVRKHGGKMPPGMTMKEFIRKADITFGVNKEEPDRKAQAENIDQAFARLNAKRQGNVQEGQAPKIGNYILDSLVR